jgi:hypothetical protein
MSDDTARPRSAHGDDSTVPSRHGESHGSVSLLFPFDVGGTYVVESPAVEREEMNQQWRRVLPEWNIRQFPSPYEKPLGWIATRALDRSKSPVLDSAIKAMPGIRVDASVQAEIIIFTVGIGLLRVHAELSEPASAVHDALLRPDVTFWGSYNPVISDTIDAYVKGLETATRACCGRGASKTAVVPRRIPQLDRTSRVRRTPFVYPLLFVANEDDYKATRPRDPKKRESVESADAKAEDRSYGDSKICVGWAASAIHLAATTPAEDIERNFVIALASWYGMVVMNHLVTLRSQERFVDLAKGERRLRAQDVRAVRLAYMEAANASHPIRWTTRQRDLLLLDEIHNAWSSPRLWDIIEHRSRLLAAHYGQLEAEAGEQRTTALTILGVMLASTTLASVVADVIGLIPGRAQYLTTTAAGLNMWMTQYGIFVAVAAAFVPLIVFLIWLSVRRQT